MARRIFVKLETVSLIIFAALAISTPASAKLYDYRSIQRGYRINSTVNDFIVVLPNSNGPRYTIEYKRDISWDSGVMVRVIFGNTAGPIHPNVANAVQMNICEMLDNARFNSTSSQAKYRMPDSLNLKGRRCPLKALPGRRALENYAFPSEFTTNKDMGCGYVTFLMRVETAGSTLRKYEPLVELLAELELTKPGGC